MKGDNSSFMDLKDLDYRELKDACSRIREKIIDETAENGGYLAANLSNVEISVALNRVFDGNACIRYAGDDLNYADRIIHGEKLLSVQNEERNDVLSECLGLACAGQLDGSGKDVIAVISETDLLSSKGLEALQMIDSSRNKLIIVFNDIRSSKSLKTLDRLISRLRNTKSYNNLKENVKDVIRPVKYGEQIIENIHDLKGK